MAKEQICVQGTSLFEVQFNIISHYQLQLTVTMAANKITSAPHNHDLDLDERESKEKVCFFGFFCIVAKSKFCENVPNRASFCSHPCVQGPSNLLWLLWSPSALQDRATHSQLPAVFVQNDNHMRLYFFSCFLYKFPFPNY